MIGNWALLVIIVRRTLITSISEIISICVL